MPSTSPDTGLFTDLYQLTMAQAYWRSRRTADATFSLAFRSYPKDRGYFVFAGLAEAIEYMERSRLLGGGRGVPTDTLGLFDPDFLEYLGEVRFTGSVRAMREGSIFFAGEPVVEVTAPVIEGQLVETALLNLISAPVLLATKASRIVHAAAGRTVVDFAARRAHSADIATRLARDSYMVGFAGTSNLLAASRYGLPAYGTMAHSFVTSFDREIDAFRAYVESFPDSSTLLVDTYDTVEGTRKAVRVALEMRERGHALRAIRLDSGDLLAPVQRVPRHPGLGGPIRGADLRQRRPGRDGDRPTSQRGGAHRRLRSRHPAGGLRRRPRRRLRLQAGGVRREAGLEAQLREADSAGAETGVPALR